jgi:hypothetical protein
MKLRRILGPKSDEVPGGWEKLDNEGIHREIIKCVEDFG